MAVTQINDVAYVTDSNGKIVGVPKAEFMVDSESDLASIEDAAPGSIAYTAAFKSMWMLDATSGDWVKL